MPEFYLMQVMARQLSNCFGICCRLKKSDRKEVSYEKAKRSVHDPDGCAGARIYVEHHGRFCQREQSKRSKDQDTDANKYAFRANPNTHPDLNCGTDGEFHRVNPGLVTNLSQ